MRDGGVERPREMLQRRLTRRTWILAPQRIGMDSPEAGFEFAEKGTRLAHGW